MTNEMLKSETCIDWRPEKGKLKMYFTIDKKNNNINKSFWPHSEMEGQISRDIPTNLASP